MLYVTSRWFRLERPNQPIVFVYLWYVVTACPRAFSLEIVTATTGILIRGFSPVRSRCGRRGQQRLLRSWEPESEEPEEESESESE